MTDPDELPDELSDALSAEEETRLAALLREAGGATSMPRDVANRLDGVLADLAAERAAPDAARGGAEVTPLHRRRRRGRVLLGAAAATVAALFVLPALLDQSTLTQSSSDAGGQVEDRVEGQADGETGSPPEAAPGTAGAEGAAPTPGWRTMPDREARLIPGLGPVELDPYQLEAGVLAALREGQRADVVPPEPESSSAECPEPALRPGESWSPAVYDGRRAVLVAAPEEAGTVAASVRDCGGTELAKVEVELR